VVGNLKGKDHLAEICVDMWIMFKIDPRGMAVKRSTALN
jgi:hypothetical protein